VIYLLDTNIVSYIITGRSPAARARLEEARSQTCISVITVGEILYGLEKIGAGPQRWKALDLFLSAISIRLWDHDAAAAYGRLRAEQERRGKPLGPYDTQIADHALALDATLVSHDAGFRQVSGLAGLEDWAGDLRG
jgi:tRNA(fMet)-specific endonuclease VapC